MFAVVAHVCDVHGVSTDYSKRPEVVACACVDHIKRDAENDRPVVEPYVVIGAEAEHVRFDVRTVMWAAERLNVRAFRIGAGWDLDQFRVRASNE